MQQGFADKSFVCESAPSKICFTDFFPWFNAFCISHHLAEMRINSSRVPTCPCLTYYCIFVLAYISVESPTDSSGIHSWWLLLKDEWISSVSTEHRRDPNKPMRRRVHAKREEEKAAVSRILNRQMCFSRREIQKKRAKTDKVCLRVCVCSHMCVE